MEQQRRKKCPLPHPSGKNLQTTLLLEENALRAMDAFHIAAALEWEAELFVSSDLHQLKAAKQVGLKVQSVP